MAERISLPQSGGGIVRYSEDYHSKLEIGPIAVVVMIVAVIVIELGLHIFLK